MIVILYLRYEFFFISLHPVVSAANCLRLVFKEHGFIHVNIQSEENFKESRER